MAGSSTGPGTEGRGGESPRPAQPEPTPVSPPGSEGPQVPAPRTPAEKEALAAILELLHETARVDFSHYRQSTVRRRLARRMDFCGRESYTAYLDRLRAGTEIA